MFVWFAKGEIDWARKFNMKLKMNDIYLMNLHGKFNEIAINVIDYCKHSSQFSLTRGILVELYFIILQSHANDKRTSLCSQFCYFCFVWVGIYAFGWPIVNVCISPKWLGYFMRIQFEIHHTLKCQIIWAAMSTAIIDDNRQDKWTDLWLVTFIGGLTTTTEQMEIFYLIEHFTGICAEICAQLNVWHVLKSPHS